MIAYIDENGTLVIGSESEYENEIIMNFHEKNNEKKVGSVIEFNVLAK